MLADGTWVLGLSAAPTRPQTRIGPGQARYSTYASRMRAGATTLMQPIWSGSRDDGLGGRAASANAVYYGDDASDDDSDEYVDSEEDGSSDSPSKSAREPSQPAAPVLRTPDEVEAAAELPPGQQLGLPVPSHRVVVRPAAKAPHVYFSEQQLAQQSEVPELLVPIRIEFHTETHRIKDVFLWNLHERLLTPYQFASMFLQDLALPLEPYAVQLEASIIQQLSDTISVLDAEGDSLNRVIDLKSSARERKRLEAEVEMQRRRVAAVSADAASTVPRKRGRPRKYPSADATSAESPPAVDSPHMPSAGAASPPPGATPGPEADAGAVDKAQLHDVLADIDAEDDVRVIVEYEVQLARYMLRDRLEWDLGSAWTPEAFAKTLTRDLGLSMESNVLISHAIREQLLQHRRAALDLGLFGSGKIYKCTMDEIMDIERAEQQQALLDGAGSEVGEALGDEASQRRAMAAAQSVDVDDASAVLRDDFAPPNTRSRRLATGGGGMDSSLGVPFVVPDVSLPLPVRRQHALATLRDLLALGPRPLEGVWRDFGDVPDFGPLLEYLSDAELEKMEEADLRASRYVRGADGRRSRRDGPRLGRARR